MNTMIPMNFVAAMKDFFGNRPGLGLMDFAKELKDLTEADRAYFKAGLEQVGYTITQAKQT